ncbi:gamma-glutamyltransferase family protein [Lutimaribacter sp. EGI FJ00015]|uniref:Gamma-glutamyltransferase family protein n=1 Tax=Lutimaribacter degradans TaxID=2945989 RepID=A0ACC5ZR63_9RHOB|nr:gamma-glutamyltransferase family protein [Lutimaribacter sp. EGI FJ00013]MCM2560762.1 gamma-glutamyltransferase family protein [Lutimaribacter sp. EGI FJ00013]MCO0612292.1 gamma-glutamyltransferase family protein [Lutimaribacter sp. EGI FJ00015]MCO0634587.1 gamma-glutamyltransferase family protein [Lutimaribacter sp. EGI FJ00014]
MSHSYQGPGRAPMFATDAMCATSHPFAARAALEILGEGGNAVDAAVAGALVLGFCEPAMTGLGGDVFALIHDPSTGKSRALNGSGRAPAALHAENLRAQGLASVSPDSIHSVTVPGAIDAFDRLIGEDGRLDLATVLAPAIHYAESGVPVHRRTAIDAETFHGRLKGAGKTHFLNAGQPYREGELFASKAQADALRLIAQDGAKAFYEGPIMEDILATLRAEGGLHTAEDFAATQATPVTPIRRAYHGHDLVELPPNGQGATALLIAALLEKFDIAALDPNGAERVHLEAEATRLAYAARNRFVGDPGDGTLDLDGMLSEQAVDALASQIDPKRAGTILQPRAEAMHKDTVYITVVDRDGLCVSLIYSVFWPYGSGWASERYGVALQNRGAGFTLDEGHVNELAGGKRPLHTLLPGLIEVPGHYAMPFGVMGGPYQATGHAHLLSNLVDFGMDIQAAIDAPRSFLDIATGKLELESTFSETVAAKLEEMGHTLTRAAVGMGGAQAIRRDVNTGLLTGGSDPRKDGIALGA